MSVRFITTGWREGKLRSRGGGLSRSGGASAGERRPTPLLLTDERAGHDGTPGTRLPVGPLRDGSRGTGDGPVGYVLIGLVNDGRCYSIRLSASGGEHRGNTERAWILVAVADGL